jgi:hypothetical protein
MILFQVADIANVQKLELNKLKLYKIRLYIKILTFKNRAS